MERTGDPETTRKTRQSRHRRGIAVAHARERIESERPYIFALQLPDRSTLNENPAITVRDLNFSYTDFPVLENVSFRIETNDIVSVVGPNGGGKTTLLRLLLGLETPGSGEIRVFGESPRRARRRIGYVPQHAQYDPAFPITVMDVVLMGRLGAGGLRGLFGWPSASDRRAATEALEEVEMTKAARRQLMSLSGGQRQRVMIARALCSKPELLLLDEPTANVDSKGERRIASLLKQLADRMTILCVSHDLGFVGETTTKALCVNRRVFMHKTAKLDGNMLHDLYESDVRVVQHHSSIDTEGNAND